MSVKVTQGSGGGWQSLKTCMTKVDIDGEIGVEIYISKTQLSRTLKRGY